MTLDTDSGLESRSGSALMRVPSDKISHLMDLVSELSLSVAETLKSPDLEGLELANFNSAAHRLSMIVREVQDAATELRLVPVEGVFRRVRRMVRELERETGKKIELAVEGEDTLIDKLVADCLYEPLVHVMRNAADHGIETPEIRRAAGKSDKGKITLTAFQQGSEVHIEVQDDGCGLNRDKILAKAKKRGLVPADSDPSDASLWKVILEPGFSTADDVSNLSGRGVGMDVLNNIIKQQRGRVGIESQAGTGTIVTLSIPVTLSFLDCIIARLKGRLYGVPIESIAEIVEPPPSDVVEMSADRHSEMLKLRDSLVPVNRIQRFYGEAPCALGQSTQNVHLIVNTSQGRFALPVDEVVDRQQVVMKPLTGALSQVRASWGCALLGSGEVATVLDCEALVAGEPK